VLGESLFVAFPHFHVRKLFALYTLEIVRRFAHQEIASLFSKALFSTVRSSLCP
jgi:hypothetical protein